MSQSNCSCLMSAAAVTDGAAGGVAWAEVALKNAASSVTTASRGPQNWMDDIDDSLRYAARCACARERAICAPRRGGPPELHVWACFNSLNHERRPRARDRSYICIALWDCRDGTGI